MLARVLEWLKVLLGDPAPRQACPGGFGSLRATAGLLADQTGAQDVWDYAARGDSGGGGTSGAGALAVWREVLRLLDSGGTVTQAQ